MKEVTADDRVWKRFFLSGLAVSIMLSVSGYVIYELIWYLDWHSDYWLFIDAFAVSLVLTIGTYLFSLLLFPLTRRLVGIPVSPLRSALAYPVIAQVWFLCVFFAFRIFVWDGDGTASPEFESIVALGLGALLQGGLIWCVYRWSYRRWPIAGRDGSFSLDELAMNGERSVRWRVYYTSAVLATLSVTSIYAYFDFGDRGFDPTLWPTFLSREMVAILVIAVTTFITTPLTFLLLLVLYPVRKRVLKRGPSFLSVSLICFISMSAQFIGFLSLGFVPDVLLNIDRFVTGFLIAFASYVAVLFLLFGCLKLVIPVRTAPAVTEVFD